jgi:hypothetical protein
VRHHYFRLHTPDDNRDSRAILWRVLNPPIGKAEVFTDRHAHDLCRIRRLSSAQLGSAPRCHLASGEVENPGLSSELAGAYERAAADQLDVVWMRGNR